MRVAGQSAMQPELGPDQGGVMIQRMVGRMFDEEQMEGVQANTDGQGV